MSENKFLKNLSQSTPPPAAEPPTDPIHRLTAELSRQSGAIEQLTGVIKRLQSQPPPATYEQVKTLAGQAPQLDAAAVADQLRPALVAALPTAQRIQEAGEAAAQQVAQAASRIPREIYVQGEILGFTSWRSLVWIVGFFSLLLFGFGFACEYQLNQAASWEQQALQARQELEAHQQFVNWLSTQKPYKNALKQYNQQVNQKEKKH